MQRKDLIILAIALGSGLLAFVLMANYLKSSASRQLQRFVIAANAIDADAVITETDLTLSEPLSNKDSKDFFLQAQDVIGSKTSIKVNKGEFILRSKVKATSAEEKDLTQQIPPGMRGISIPIQSIDNMPDLVKPGSYVDIMGKVANDSGRQELRTIFRAAKVIAMKKSEEKDSTAIRSVTIALSALGAEVVTRALLQGKIGLILRPGKDGSSGVDTAGLDYIEIVRGITKEKSTRFTKNTSGLGSYNYE